MFVTEGVGLFQRRGGPGLEGAHNASTLQVTREPSNVRADLERYLRP